MVWSTVNMRTLTVTSLAVLLALSAASSQADTYSNGSTSDAMTVTLVIESGCALTANDLEFGTATVLTSAVTANTSLSITCTSGTPYNVGIDAGTVTGSTTTTRLMTGGDSETVSFTLWQDAALSTAWGAEQDTDTYAGTGTGAAQSVTVYGQVPAQTTPSASTYSTTLTASVYF
jgi:spore coat protein U-like protein